MASLAVAWYTFRDSRLNIKSRADPGRPGSAAIYSLGVGGQEQTATDLLYSGEQYDAGVGQQYLRARYYHHDTGRFNRVDPFEGVNADPQSLHKYAYAHADPKNVWDPSGRVGVAVRIGLAILARVVVYAVPVLLLLGVYQLHLVERSLHAAGTSRPIGSSDLRITMAIAEMQSQFLEGTSEGGTSGSSAAVGREPRRRIEQFINDVVSGDYQVHEIPESVSKDFPFPAFHLRTLPGSGFLRYDVANGTPLIFALAAFAEWQHDPLGGGLDEGDADTELQSLKGKITTLPPEGSKDLEIIQDMRHGGVFSRF